MLAQCSAKPEQYFSSPNYLPTVHNVTCIQPVQTTYRVGQHNREKYNITTYNNFKLLDIEKHTRKQYFRYSILSRHFFSTISATKLLSASMTTLGRVQKHVHAHATSDLSIFLINSEILCLIESLLASE